MRIALRAWMWLIYILLYVPILVVIVYSFNDARHSIAWKGFTLKWYSMCLKNTALIDAALNSLSVGTLSATLATILGTLTAITLQRHSFSGKRLLYGGIYVLTVSPDIVMGISLLIFFISIKLPLGFTTLVAAHITLSLPFVTLTVLARLAKFDNSLIEAAKDLGASEFKAFRHIILPLIMPSVVAGWLLAFTLSIDDVLISFFVAGPGYEVLPLKIYSMVRLGVKPDTNALSAIMFTVTLVLILLAQFLNQVRRT
jgi:spermidine/putrescine transport system permease protein